MSHQQIRKIAASLNIAKKRKSCGIIENIEFDLILYFSSFCDRDATGERNISQSRSKLLEIPTSGEYSNGTLSID